MTEEEIKAIETHIEIHAKAEPGAIKITEILRKAVRELGGNKHLKEEMEIMVNFCGACKKKHEDEIETLKHNKKTVAHLSNCISDIQEKKITDLEKQLEQAKEIIKKCIEYYLDRTNEFHDGIITEAEQFLKEE
ncbi:MAG: CGGC domain-containing protein [Methanobrevibacter sp.]|nr:CGGC domain-containing protein [Methanobrevibacter sp.]